MKITEKGRRTMGREARLSITCTPEIKDCLLGICAADNSTLSDVCERLFIRAFNIPKGKGRPFATP